MDEFDGATTPYDETEHAQHVPGSSRRTFLKAAVVGSAAAVTVSGVGAATLTLTGRHTGLKRFVILTDTISGVTGNACTTTSSDVEQDSFGNESIYFWAKFNAVPAGQYTIDVSPSIPTSLVDYQGSGNMVFIYNYPGGASFTCNPASMPDSTTALAHSHTLSITFTTPSDGDVLLQLHLQGTGATGSQTLTATLYQGATESTSVDSASATFSLT